MRFYSSIPALTVVIIIVDGNTARLVWMEMGLLPRILFYPTLVHNICLEKVTNRTGMTILQKQLFSEDCHLNL